MHYNPYVDVTRDTTTLYASDRDVFIFLVDDTHPIEAGKLPNGDPDLYFRGFYCWNSEVGAKTLGMATFYLRAVCMNRNLWGVENFEEVKIRHSKFAANRFAHEAAPALEHFADSSPMPFLSGIKTARERIVARKDEDRETFLRKRGFSKAETAKIVATVLNEEGRPPETIYDFVQGITAFARTRTTRGGGAPRAVDVARLHLQRPAHSGPLARRDREADGRSRRADMIVDRSPRWRERRCRWLPNATNIGPGSLSVDVIDTRRQASSFVKVITSRDQCRTPGMSLLALGA